MALNVMTESCNYSKNLYIGKVKKMDFANSSRSSMVIKQATTLREQSYDSDFDDADSMDVGSEFQDDNHISREERQNIYHQNKRNMRDLGLDSINIISNKELAKNRNLKEFSDLIMRKS